MHIMKKSHKHSKITVCSYNSPWFEKLQEEEQKDYKVILQVLYLHDSKIIVESVDKELYEKEEKINEYREQALDEIDEKIKSMIIEAIENIDKDIK